LSLQWYSEELDFRLINKRINKWNSPKAEAQKNKINKRNPKLNIEKILLMKSH
jgi:hypothetical protein